MKSNDDFKIITGFIVTGIIMAISAFIIYYNFQVCKAPYIISIVFALIPSIIAIFKLFKLYKDTTGSYVFLNIVLIVLALFFFICSVIAFKTLNKVTNVSDYNAYEKVLKYEKYPSNKKIAHFPSTIPSEASSKEFKEWGTLGSDDSGMILSYSLNSNEIKGQEFIDKIQNAKFKASSKTGLDEIGQKLYIPQAIYDNLGLSNNNSSSDFTAYILDASEVNSDNSKMSYSYGIIVNNMSNNITYYSINSKK